MRTAATWSCGIATCQAARSGCCRPLGASWPFFDGLQLPRPPDTPGGAAGANASLDRAVLLHQGGPTERRVFWRQLSTLPHDHVDAWPR
eukprot:3027788-Prymnesium_polylepis.1